MKFSGGVPETPCGYGSTLEYTAGIRESLPLLLHALDVRTLLDAPCGDCNWISKVKLGIQHYIGCELDEDIFQLAIEAEIYAGRKSLYLLDVTRDVLPPSDMVLCRDFFQHIPTEKIFRTIDNIKRSGARWLLATSHTNQENREIAHEGHFRPVNLQRKPFSFPYPTMSIVDGNNILGAWPVHSL